MPDSTGTPIAVKAARIRPSRVNAATRAVAYHQMSAREKRARVARRAFGGLRERVRVVHDVIDREARGDGVQHRLERVERPADHGGEPDDRDERREDRRGRAQRDEHIARREEEHAKRERHADEPAADRGLAEDLPAPRPPRGPSRGAGRPGPLKGG